MERVVSKSKTDNPKHLDEQTVEDAAGPLFHRLYYVDIPTYNRGPEKLVHEVLNRINDFAPHWLATFERPEEQANRDVRKGDEFLVRMSAPYNGPVRVKEIDETSFTLCTLKGHMESGQIRFSASQREKGVRFEIESMSRSRDRIVDIIYDKLRLAKWMQTTMWVSFLKQVAKQTAGHTSAKVNVQTQRCSEDGAECELVDRPH